MSVVGERSDEESNHGLIYIAFSTLGDAGSKDIRPFKCFNNALYRRWDTLQQHLEQLPHKIARCEEYGKVHLRGIWVKHLMRQNMNTIQHINEK
jgi:hypothetical protein